MAVEYPTRQRQQQEYPGTERRRGIIDRRRSTFDLYTGKSDLGAVFLAVFAGLGTTMMLIVLGLAIGLVSVDGGTDIEGVTDISSFVGWWVVGAGLIGAFVGGLLGGRSAGLLGRTTPIAHGAAAWGLTFLIVAALIGAMSLSLFGTATTSTAALSDDLEAVSESLAQQSGLESGAILETLEGGIPTAGDTAVVVSNEAGEAAWWMFGWLLLALIGSVGGWMFGAASKPMTGMAASSNGHGTTRERERVRYDNSER